VSSVNIVFTSVKAAAGMSLLDSGLVKHELGERAVAGLPLVGTGPIVPARKVF
jgi:hypothetical protein